MANFNRIRSSTLVGTAGVLLSSVLLASVGAAAVIEGQFSGIIDRAGAPFLGNNGEAFSGRYSYDDQATTLGAGPGSFFEATIYPAISFEIDGVAVPGTPAIWILDGFLGTGRDSFGVLVLGTPTGGYPAFGLGRDGGLWSSEDLSMLNGRVFSDFTAGSVATTPGPANLPRGTVTGWSQSVVPESGTAILVMLGLSGLAAGRRVSG